MSLCFESRSAQSFLLKSHGDLAASQLWMTNHRGLRLILTLLECEMRALDGANLCQESSNHCDVSLIWFFDRSHKFVQGKEEPRETVCTGGLTWNVIGHIHTHQSDMVNHGLKLASKQGGWLTGLAVSQETKKRNTNSLGGLPDAAACGSCHKGPTSVHGIRGTHKPRPSLCSVSVKTGKSNPHFQTIHSDWQTCNHVNTPTVSKTRSSDQILSPCFPNTIGVILRDEKQSGFFQDFSLFDCDPHQDKNWMSCPNLLFARKCNQFLLITFR